MTPRQTYFARLSHLDRPALLKLCRAGGFSAQAIKSNNEIIDLLWRKFGCRK